MYKTMECRSCKSQVKVLDPKVWLATAQGYCAHCRSFNTIKADQFRVACHDCDAQVLVDSYDFWVHRMAKRCDNCREGRLAPAPVHPTLFPMNTSRQFAPPSRDELGNSMDNEPYDGSPPEFFFPDDATMEREIKLYGWDMPLDAARKRIKDRLERIKNEGPAPDDDLMAKVAAFNALHHV